MGCIGSKHATDDNRGHPEDRYSRKESSKYLITQNNISRREEHRLDRLDSHTTNGRSVLIDNKRNGSNHFLNDQIEKKLEKSKVGVIRDPESKRLSPNAIIDKEQVAAGWPSWLVEVAGEAIKGWLPMQASRFEKLEQIGQGTYSNVYKARDVDQNKFVALKRVRFDVNDLDSLKFMAREIVILRQLDHPNVIKLEGLIASTKTCSLYLVFEYMEHDLLGLASRPGVKFSEPEVKCYMKQLLSGLDHCHSRGVLHRDIKGSNLLINSNGILKIADFGLATFFDPHKDAQMTSRVVTLWYRPPELLLGSPQYGIAVDLWSAGCILGELYSGKPILPGKTEVEQLHKIFKLCGSPSEEYWRKSKLKHSPLFKSVYRRCLSSTYTNFPTPVMALMETLLSIDPDHRGTATCALKSEFFTKEPVACDPSSLPKYPPSKEIDAKRREEQERRQRHVPAKGERINFETRCSKETVPAPTRNNVLSATSLQQHNPNLNNIRNTHNEHATSGCSSHQAKRLETMKDLNKRFLERQSTQVSRSGIVHENFAWSKTGEYANNDHQSVSPIQYNPSRSSGPLAIKRPSDGNQQGAGPSGAAVNPVQMGRDHALYSDSYSASKQVMKNNSHKVAHYPQSISGRMSFKEPSSHYPMDEKIYASGPLFAQMNNMDQMLKERDRQIQDFARRARVDKKKHKKVYD